MVFVMRKLDEVEPSLGQKLRSLRRGQAVSLDMISAKTKIQKRFLSFLEQGKYEELPDPIYCRNYIRMYARALGADEKYFLELYDEECGQCDLVAPMQTPRQRLRRVKLLVWNHFTKFLLVFIGGAIVVAYIVNQFVQLIAPPNLIIYSPAPESTTQESSIVVEGLVDEESSVLINGDSVMIFDDSTFRETVDLRRGLNTITIEASKRYSRTKTQSRIIRFEPEE